MIISCVAILPVPSQHVISPLQHTCATQMPGQGKHCASRHKSCSRMSLQGSMRPSRQGAGPYLSCCHRCQLAPSERPCVPLCPAQPRCGGSNSSVIAVAACAAAAMQRQSHRAAPPRSAEQLVLWRLQYACHCHRCVRRCCQAEALTPCCPRPHVLATTLRPLALATTLPPLALDTTLRTLALKTKLHPLALDTTLRPLALLDSLA